MTNRAAATRYARALFEVSLDGGDPERAERELSAFQELLDGHRTLASALVNPAISPMRKRAVMAAILEPAETAEVLKRLLLMLAERDRLGLLPDLIDVYRERLMDHLEIVRARVTTAQPLDAARVESISQTLAAATGRKVTIETAVDDSLVGGIVTQIGSTVYDGSLAHHLGRLKQRFMGTA